MSRYVVLGAGAVGGTIGGRLFQAGHDVQLVARGEHGAAVRAGGLLLRDPDAEARLPIPCVNHPSAVPWRGDELVVVATKTQQAPAALDDLARHAPANIVVVCATNGLEAERLALRRFPSVIAMTVLLPATHLEPGVVDAFSAPVSGILDVGRFPSGVDGTTEQLATDLAGATFLSETDPDVLRRKRRKLILNLANALEAATGSLGRGSDLLQRAAEEAEACFAAAGWTVATAEEDAARRADHLALRRVAGERRPGGSTWQSLARGRGDVETDYLNGEIVLLGRLHGVATPVNELLQTVARELSAAGAAPGSMSVEALEARLTRR